MGREHHIRRDQQLEDGPIIRGPESAAHKTGAEIDRVSEAIVGRCFSGTVGLPHKGVGREVDMAVGEVTTPPHSRSRGEDDRHRVHPLVFRKGQEVGSGIVV